MVLSLWISICQPALADEGMWLPEQLAAYEDELVAMGLEVPVDELIQPGGSTLGAVAWLGHCSGGFVSDQGLLITNAHCARGFLQYASEGIGNLMEEGYTAHSMDEELWAGPSARAYVIRDVQDVTRQIQDALEGVRNDEDRYEVLERTRKEILATCESEEGLRCQVAEFYGGLEYRLVVRTEIRDLRLVYAPSDEVYFFGGDEDNWMWPRHTGDFAFLRAYVSPDGQPVANAQDNVPYAPPAHFDVQSDGVDQGDFVFIAGFPGSTFRYRTSDEIAHAQNVRYPEGIALFEELNGILRRHASESDEAAQRLGNYLFSLANQTKNYRGMLDNFETSGLVARKQAESEALDQWVQENRRRRRTYESSLNAYYAEVNSRLEGYRRDRLVGLSAYFPQLLRASRTAYRLSMERSKPDVERRRGYQARDEERIRNMLQSLDRGLFLPADRDLALAVLGRLQALPEEARVGPLDAWIEAQGGLEAAVELLYTEPSLVTEEARLALMEMDREAMESAEDPWIQLAVAMETWVEDRRAEDDRYRGAMIRLRPLYMQALIEMRGGNIYPDANGTLRLSIGQVRGYSPSEAVNYRPLTTVRGMLDKAGDPPFVVPDSLRNRAEAGEPGELALNFLTTLDNTGGNSGSPTLNSKGELVGLVFDRNYEAMAADWLYDPQLTRSIHVDIRFVLWMLREVAQSQWLLDEMGLEN